MAIGYDGGINIKKTTLAVALYMKIRTQFKVALTVSVNHPETAYFCVTLTQ